MFISIWAHEIEATNTNLGSVRVSDSGLTETQSQSFIDPIHD